jgi:hypothetical protein
MAVAPIVTRAIIEEQLKQLRELGESHGWEIHADLSALKVECRMRAHNGDRFIVEADCENYQEWPPFFEFIDPDTGARGTKRAYPKTTDSFFHESGPCICAPFNRKAYRAVVGTGPHGDWAFGDWMISRANGFDWSHVTTLGDMFSMIQTRLLLSDLYKGRMT